MLRGDPGQKGTRDSRNFQFGSDVDGMHRPRATKASICRIARIVTASNRNRAGGACHARIDDLPNAPCNLQRVHLELPGQGARRRDGRGRD